jgi:hypothetical protein
MVSIVMTRTVVATTLIVNTTLVLDLATRADLPIELVRQGHARHRHRRGLLLARQTLLQLPRDRCRPVLSLLDAEHTPKSQCDAYSGNPLGLGTVERDYSWSSGEEAW